MYADSRQVRRARERRKRKMDLATYPLKAQKGGPLRGPIRRNRRLRGDRLDYFNY